MKKIFFLSGAYQGEGKFFIFFIIRDKTIKHKYQYLHLNQRNSTKNFFARGVPGGGGKIFIFVIIRDRTFKLRYQYFHIYLRSSKKIFFAWGGGKFLFSLLLEIGPSNLNIKISILI